MLPNDGPDAVAIDLTRKSELRITDDEFLRFLSAENCTPRGLRVYTVFS